MDGQAPAAPAAGRGPGGLSADDSVAKAKREFIGKNGLVVFGLRDHWQSRKENEMVTGLAGALGWSARRVNNDDVLYEIPPATAEASVAVIRSKTESSRRPPRCGRSQRHDTAGSAVSRLHDSGNDVATLFGGGSDRRW